MGAGPSSILGGADPFGGTRSDASLLGCKAGAAKQGGRGSSKARLNWATIGEAGELGIAVSVDAVFLEVVAKLTAVEPKLVLVLLRMGADLLRMR